MTDLTAVSLFAGVGGIDLALERAGVKVTAAVEINDAARGVIADRMPGTTLFTDVTKVTADELRATGFVPERGILAAGWPCQGNSVAGRRGGMADPRSGLWRHVVRLLAETRARWFLGENVPGLLSVNDGDDFGVVVHDLGSLGYGGASRVLDAQFFGVPQRRRRVFFVGCLGDQRRPVQVLAEPEGGAGNPPASGQTWTQVAPTLESGSNQTGGTRPPGTTVDTAESLIVDTYQKVVRSGERDAEGNLPPEVWAHRDVSATLNRMDNASESRAVELVVSTTGTMAHTLTAKGHDASEDGTGRGTPIVTALTTRYGNTQDDQQIGQLVQSETFVRRLTPRECERLQGFPDDWTATSNGKPQSDSPRYQQMGNAVAVPCVEWIARRIVRADA